VTVGAVVHGPATAPAVSVTPALSVAAGTPITATAINGAVPAGGNLRYDFDFGDKGSGSSQNTQIVFPAPGSPTRSASASYTYAVAGTYKVAVTTTDGTNKAVSTPILVTVTGTPPPPPPGGGGQGAAVSRVSGADRYLTSVAVSSKLPAGSAPAVVLATGDNFPDALAGIPLAKKVGGPLLLTPSAGPDAAVTAEIHRVLKPGGTVYVLGGEQAVPLSVVRALGSSVTVTRIGGADRFDTSLLIAKQLGDPNHVVLATGINFPDALAAGPYAADVFGANAASPAAILLTDDAKLPAGVKAYLAGASAVAAVGGQAVTAAANAHINLAAGFRGVDRYQTASMVAATFSGEKTAGVATGEKFADALTGAAYLADNDGPLVLTETKHLTAPWASGALQGIAVAVGPTGTIEVFGGPVAISDAAFGEVVVAVHGHAS